MECEEYVGVSVRNRRSRLKCLRPTLGTKSRIVLSRFVRSHLSAALSLSPSAACIPLSYVSLRYLSPSSRCVPFFDVYLSPTYIFLRYMSPSAACPYSPSLLRVSSLSLLFAFLRRVSLSLFLSLLYFSSTYLSLLYISFSLLYISIYSIPSSNTLFLLCL